MKLPSHPFAILNRWQIVLVEAVVLTLTLEFGCLGEVSTIVKFSLKQLHSDHSKYEHEQQIDHQYVEHIFQRVDNTIEYGF